MGEQRAMVMTQAAAFDNAENRTYRYELTRRWRNKTEQDPDDGKQMERDNIACFIMLNPSKGDEYIDDPAIDRCIQLVHDWDTREEPGSAHNGVSIVNLFAFIASSPSKLPDNNAEGMENDDYINEAIRKYKDNIIIAWGKAESQRMRRTRAEHVLNMLRGRTKLFHLELDEAGHENDCRNEGKPCKLYVKFPYPNQRKPCLNNNLHIKPYVEVRALSTAGDSAVANQSGGSTPPGKRTVITARQEQA